MEDRPLRENAAFDGPTRLGPVVIAAKALSGLFGFFLWQRQRGQEERRKSEKGKPAFSPVSAGGELDLEMDRGRRAHSLLFSGRLLSPCRSSRFEPVRLPTR